MPLSIGNVLKGRYIIQNPIGKGGMGAIWLASDNRLEGRYCAVKEIVRDVSATNEYQEQAREQFHREASILARLDHPNLPKVSDFFTDIDTDILIMDYVDGEDLRQKMGKLTKEQFIDESQVYDWTKQIFEALEYLHSQDPPVVHRDIKPSNIKVTTTGIVKLVDFGLVKVMTPEERTVTIVQGRGTIHYTPIEQYGADEGHTDLRSDIYSLGCTLYHLLTNQTPPEAKVRFLHSHVMTPIRSINTSISNRAEKAIEWAVSLHPEDRPETIDQFRAALFDGIIPNKQGVPEYIPNNNQEWLQYALSDPLHRDLAILSTLLIILAVITTFTS